MTRTRFAFLVGVLGVLLAFADLLGRYGLGWDSPLGLHVHAMALSSGAASRHDFVIPGFFGVLVSGAGFGVFLGLRLGVIPTAGPRPGGRG